MGKLSSRRANRGWKLLALFAIGVPAVALVVLGVDAVRRERQAVASLEASTLRLSGERVADELERRGYELAGAFLSEPALREGAEGLVRERTPEGIRRFRGVLEGLRERHPILRHVFLLEKGSVRFPLARDLPSWSPEEVGPRSFTVSFREAERLEREGKTRRALETYRASASLGVPVRLEALALSRAARCWRQLGNGRDAERAYRRLVEDHGDVYDPFHRPYALVAALELGVDGEGALALASEIGRGRWELSAEQADFFLTSLETPERRDARYLDELAFARSLERHFLNQRTVGDERVSGAVLSRDGNYRQLFYQAGAELTLGFDADLDWITAELLPRAIEGAEIASNLDVRIGAPDASGIAFPTLFPFWNVEMVLRQPAALAEAALYGGAIALVLSLLGFGVLLLVRDASRERKLADMRSDLVSGVSHELKTPLTLVRLYTETLLEGGKHSAEERGAYYRIILRESERLTHLVEKVLDFARIHRDQKEYHLEEGDLASTVSETIEAYREYLSRRGFSISVTVEPELPSVRFDARAVSQAVVNLVDNAVKYGGEAKYVRLALFREGSDAVFLVEDRGPGVALEEREKIFEPFYRAERTRSEGGYGLGLYLVKHIMEAHGGRIEIESEPGRGSTFRLSFPIVSGREAD